MSNVISYKCRHCFFYRHNYVIKNDICDMCGGKMFIVKRAARLNGDPRNCRPNLKAQNGNCRAATIRKEV